jgi:MFS family permease
MRRIGDVKFVGLGMALFALGVTSFISHSLALVLAGMAVGGAGLAWLIVGYATAIQLRTPLRLQGRVLSASDTLVSTPQTVSIALGAALVSVFDYRLLVGAMAMVVAACGAYLFTREPEAVAAEKDPAFA